MKNRKNASKRQEPSEPESFVMPDSEQDIDISRRPLTLTHPIFSTLKGIIKDQAEILRDQQSAINRLSNELADVKQNLYSINTVISPPIQEAPNN